MSSSKSSSWTVIADDGKKYTNTSLGKGSETGTVKVFSRRISLFFGVHHGIILAGAKYDKGTGVPLYVVYEWMDDGYHSYATDKIHPGSSVCRILGTYSADQVWEAAERASKGRTYSVSFENCNHWTERVASNLGLSIAVHWDCSCVVHPKCLRKFLEKVRSLIRAIGWSIILPGHVFNYSMLNDKY